MEHKENESDVYVVDDSEGLRIKKRSNSHKRKPTNLNKPLGHRPPWNNDTKIEGYDDVDENGRYRRRNQPYTNDIRKKKNVEQEELNHQWSHSLRDTFHDE